MVGSGGDTEAAMQGRGEALAPQGLTQTAAGARLSGEAVAAQVAAALG